MAERDEPRKIALVGTCCVGKTTLLDFYTEDQDVAISEEAARVFFTINPDVPDRFSVDVQGQIQAMAMSNEKQASTDGVRALICDRSVLDAVVYTYARGNKEGARALFTKVEFWLPTYHKFLLLDPRDVPYQTDDVRREDEETRQQLHDAYIEFFEANRIVYELLSGTVKQRMERINQILQE